jgi:hypothetical protein
MKYVSLAMALTLAIAATLVEAKDAPPGRDTFAGSWVHAGDSKEAEQRRQAIEAGTKDMAPFIRGTARERLDKQTTPPPELRLEVEGDRFDISRDSNTVSLRFGAKPITMDRNGKQGKVSVRFVDEQIVVVSEGENGKRVTKYALSRDRKRLTMSVRMTGERLAGPLVFQSTYRRK